jgi:regulator of RNase E activity RraA
MVGHAYTLRYVPAREDLGVSSHFDNDTNQQRLAVEDISEGQVLVIDARQDTSVGSLGNILSTRLQQRGAAGLVTDGALRDSPAIAQVGLPTYAAGSNARLSSVVHHPADRNVPIGCAGVLILPGDVLVGDDEGVVVIPSAMASPVARDAERQERLEEFITDQVRRGASIKGVYPPQEALLRAYDESARSLPRPGSN